jgi:predicted DNA-binding transcriptional regulator AlpA
MVMARFFTVEDVMELYGVSKGYVYKLASIHQWRRRKRFGGVVEYYWLDVDAVLGDG